MCCAVLSCLWESAVYQKDLPMWRQQVSSKKYVTMTICLRSNSRWYESQCALEASLNKTKFPLFFIPELTPYLLLAHFSLRRETYWTLKVLRPGQLSDRLRLELSRDPLAPLLEEAWYPALERRLVGIIKMIDQCTAAVGGLEHMLVG